MKTGLTTIKICVFILSFSLLLFSEVKADDVITFSAGAPLDSYQGRVITALLTEAFKRNGQKFQAKYYPSLRSLHMANSGQTDGELHRVHEFHKVSKGKYPNLIRIESKLLSIWLAAFATKPIIINDWHDLKGYKVLYYRGRKNVETFLHQVLPPEKIKSTTTDEQAFKMLAAGRADIVISESREGNRIINSHPRFSKVKEIKQLNETLIYAYFNKKHQSLEPKLAKILEAMKKDGTFDKIIDKVNTEMLTSQQQ